MTKRLLLLLALSIYGLNLHAASRTFVCAVSGSDTNPCSVTAPCRSFIAALASTDPDGELVVLDSGGYGPATILQGVSILSPGGVYAGVTATSGDAITINAPDTAHVALRNLFLNAIGAFNGVNVNSVGVLYVDGCTITGFTSTGIVFASTTGTQRMNVSNSTIRRCGYAAVYVGYGIGTIQSVQLLDNQTGVMSWSTALAIVRNCVAKGNSYYGYYAGTNGKTIVEDSVASANYIGFYANLGMMTITRCTSVGNANGILSDSGGTTIYISDSTISTNTLGVGGVNGNLTSRGNNTLYGNTTDGAFTATFSAQ